MMGDSTYKNTLECFIKTLQTEVFYFISFFTSTPKGELEKKLILSCGGLRSDNESTRKIRLPTKIDTRNLA